MSIPPEIMALIQAANGISGKAGSQLTSGDLSRFFSKEFGAMSGSDNSQPDPVESDDDIRSRTSPYLLQIIKNMGADKAASLIADDVQAGLPLIQMKKNLRQVFVEMGIPSEKKKQTDEQKATISDYSDLLDTLSKEQNSYLSETNKIKNAPAKETFYSKAGLSEPNAPYDPKALMGGLYAKLAERAAPRELHPQTDATAPANKYDIPNERRAIEALNSAKNMEDMTLRNMQRRGAGSPFLDQMKQRLLMARMIESGKV